MAESSGRPNRRLWTALCPQLGGSSEASPSFPPSPTIQHRKARLTRPFLVLQPCSHPSSLNPCASLYVHKIWILLCKNFSTLWFAIHSNTSNLKNPVYIYPRHYELFGSWLLILYLSTLPIHLQKLLSNLPYPLFKSHPLSYFRT